MSKLDLLVEVATLFVAVIAFVFSCYCLRFTRLTISTDYRSNILTWINKCLETMGKLRFCSKSDPMYNQLLSELLVLADEARFFFPNIDHYDGFGKGKLLVFQGYRCYLIDYILLFYNIFSGEKTVEEKDCRTIYENFLSDTYEFLDPPKFITTLNKQLKTSYHIFKARENKPEFREIMKDIAYKYNVGGMFQR